jgi:hypothetical protein
MATIRAGRNNHLDGLTQSLQRKAENREFSLIPGTDADFRRNSAECSDFPAAASYYVKLPLVLLFYE